MDKSEPLDLSQLHLTPDWVKQPDVSNKYSEYEGERAGSDRRKGDGRGGRPGGGAGAGGQGDRRGGKPGAPRGDRDKRGGGGAGGGGAGGAGGAGREQKDRRDRDKERGGGGPGARPGARPQGDQRGRGPGQGQGQGQGQRQRDDRGRRGDDRGDRGDRRGREDRGQFRSRDREPLPEGIEIRFVPAQDTVESLARQIKATGRAYSVFDLAKLVLDDRDRFEIEFLKTNAAPEQLRFFQCNLDHSLWMGRDEALRRALNADEFSQFYKTEHVEIEAPKGNFSVVAVCGMSGELLGPPNHHDYQKDLNRLYQERFSNVPFDVFKRRIRMESDEATMQKWVEKKSKAVHHTYLKGPEGEEPLVLTSEPELERHAREYHMDDLVKETGSARVPGNIPGSALAPALLAILRREADQQMRFPMPTVKTLCRQLEDLGLKFFKDEDEKGRKTTYVCRSRPRAIENTSEISGRIRKIVGLVRDNPGIDYALVVAHMTGKKSAAAPEVVRAKQARQAEAEAHAHDSAAQKEKHEHERDETQGTGEVEAAGAAEAVTVTADTPEAHAFPPEGETAPAEVVEPSIPSDDEPSSEMPPAEPTADAVDAAKADTGPEALVETEPETEAEAEAEPETKVASEIPAEPAADVADAVDATSSQPARETDEIAPVEVQDTAPQEATGEASPATTGDANAVSSEAEAATKQSPESSPSDASVPVVPAGPSEEEIGILKDLRWLIREGYVIEYSTGAMRLARAHVPNKPRPKKKKADQPKPGSDHTTAPAGTAAPKQEAAPGGQSEPEPQEQQPTPEPAPAPEQEPASSPEITAESPEPEPPSEPSPETQPSNDEPTAPEVEPGSTQG